MRALRSARRALVRRPMWRVALLLDELHADLLRGLSQPRDEPLDRHALWDRGCGEAHGDRREHAVFDEDGHGHRHLLRHAPGADGRCVALLARLIEDLLDLRPAPRELILLPLRP